eukprot:1300510-Alexandrium_andersonii.AAC.1
MPSEALSELRRPLRSSPDAPPDRHSSPSVPASTRPAKPAIIRGVLIVAGDGRARPLARSAHHG